MLGREQIGLNPAGTGSKQHLAEPWKCHLWGEAGKLGQEAGFTLQEVPGTQVDVDAGVETRDEPVESSFLHTDPCKEKGNLRHQKHPLDFQFSWQ